jgi:hypothetical protein
MSFSKPDLMLTLQAVISRALFCSCWDNCLQLLGFSGTYWDHYVEGTGDNT